MKKICIISIVILLLWFTLDLTGFSIGDVTLVEAAWNSIDGVWWLIFIALSILFIVKDKIGKYLLSVFIFLWVIIQYFSHWYYTLFGASDKKIISYNRFFKETYHIIGPSETMVVPDLYHIVLHILILETLICLIVFCINSKKTVYENIS